MVYVVAFFIASFSLYFDNSKGGEVYSHNEYNILYHMSEEDLTTPSIISLLYILPLP